MPSDWRYKVVERSAPETIRAIVNHVKGMSSKEGSFPAETTLHGRLGGGLYAYVYPLPLEMLEIFTDEVYYGEIEFGTLLKHKPKNESIWHPFTAVDVSTRVSGQIVCVLDPKEGEELIDWISENYQSLPPMSY